MSEDKTVIILRRNFCPSRDDAKLLTLADEFFSPGLFFYWALFEGPDIVLVG